MGQVFSKSQSGGGGGAKEKNNPLPATLASVRPALVTEGLEKGRSVRYSCLRSRKVKGTTWKPRTEGEVAPALPQDLTLTAMVPSLH